MTRKRLKNKNTAIGLAIVLGFWTWTYTWKDDFWKFFVGGILSLVFWFTLIVPIGVWIWAIIDTIEKSEKWYKDY